MTPQKPKAIITKGQGELLPRMAATLVILVGFAARIYRLGEKNIWWDEALSVIAARLPLVETTNWTAADVHPPLYFWQLWGWMRLFGETEFALRLVTVFTSLLTVAAVIALTRSVTRSNSAGALAGLAIALSRFSVWWAEEMRMYSLAALFMTLFLLATYRFLKGDRSKFNLAAIVLAEIAAISTIYVAATAALSVNLAILIVGFVRHEKARFWRSWTATQLAALALFSPWLMYAIPKMRSWTSVSDPISLSAAAKLNLVVLTHGLSKGLDSVAVSSAAIALLAALGIVFWWRGKGESLQRATKLSSLALLLLPLLLHVVFGWLTSQPREQFYVPALEARYFLLLSPAAYVLFGVGVYGWIKSKNNAAIRLLAVIAPIVVFASALSVHYQDRSYDDSFWDMSREIWSQGQRGDCVILISEDRAPIFNTYYESEKATDSAPPYCASPLFGFAIDSNSVELLQKVSMANGRIWLVEFEKHLQDPGSIASWWLGNNMIEISRRDYGANRVSLFSHEDKPASVASGWLDAGDSSLVTDSPQGLELFGFDILPRRIIAPDVIRAAVYARSSEEVNLRVTLRDGLGGELSTATSTLAPSDEAQRVHFELPIWGDSRKDTYAAVLSTEIDDEWSIVLGEFQIHPGQEPPPDWVFEGGALGSIEGVAEIAGYDLWGSGRAQQIEARAGDLVSLTIYYEPTSSAAASYKVFVHLQGTEFNPQTSGPLWAQEDKIPLYGTLPTSVWREGRVVADSYRLALPENTPPGEYQINVGMYSLERGERLPTSGPNANPESSIRLATVVVVP